VAPRGIYSTIYLDTTSANTYNANELYTLIRQDKGVPGLER